MLEYTTYGFKMQCQVREKGRMRGEWTKGTSSSHLKSYHWIKAILNVAKTENGFLDCY